MKAVSQVLLPVFTVGMVFFGLTFSASALAQVTDVEGAQYRQFEAKISTITGEEKTVTLQVNVELSLNKVGDPELGHGEGHYDYFITGSILEDNLTCKFEILRTQSDLEHSTKDANQRADRTGSLRLCSALWLSLESVKYLLMDQPMIERNRVEVYTVGLRKALGSGLMNYRGLKTVPASNADLDRHN